MGRCADRCGNRRPAYRSRAADDAGFSGPRSTPTSDQLPEAVPAPPRRKKNVDGVAHPGCSACAAVTLTPTKSPDVTTSDARADPLDTIIGSPTGVR